MANAKYYGTGRRKKSVARVYLVPGTGVTQDRQEQSVTVSRELFLRQTLITDRSLRQQDSLHVTRE